MPRWMNNGNVQGLSRCRRKENANPFGLRGLESIAARARAPGMLNSVS